MEFYTAKYTYRLDFSGTQCCVDMLCRVSALTLGTVVEVNGITLI